MQGDRGEDRERALSALELTVILGIILLHGVMAAVFLAFVIKNF